MVLYGMSQLRELDKPFPRKLVSKPYEKVVLSP